LSLWASTQEQQRGKAQEVKDLLIELARTAQALAERDQRYSAQLHQFTRDLHAVADLEDLAQVRSSLMRTANKLRKCVNQVDQDSQQTIAQLSRGCHRMRAN